VSDLSDQSDQSDQSGLSDVSDLGASGASDFDTARFRQVLGHFCTGVVIIAGSHDGEPVGLTVQSFTSLSLEPPLVSFAVGRTSSTWPRLRDAGTFSVNILAEDQEALCRTFATSGADKFAGVGWRPGASGAPLLDDVLAWLECRIDIEHDAGDHILVIGRVTGLDVGREGKPLLFYRGGFGRFEL
jgi:3-hydroxy-9,10-secoandrosta-1,3,5(10)-triene-9,17-dione monooxygenase reductase component